MVEGMYLLKGLLIGLIFGVPAGVIGMMTIQRTLEYGFRAGIITGFGSMAADLIYGCIGVCGLTAVSNVLFAWERSLRMIGGILIVGLGIVTFRKKAVMQEPGEMDANKIPERHSLQSVFLFTSSFFTAITNPTTILAFLTVFASFGILGGVTGSEGCLLLCGLALGTGSWWIFLAGITNILRERINERIYKYLNRILGILMVLFGIGAAAGGLS